MIYRKVTTVLFEALVIGLMSVLLFMGFNYIPLISIMLKVFLVGFLMHLIFEYLTLNYKWCKSVYEMK